KGKLNAEELARQLCRQTLGRVLNELPESWRTLAEKVGMAELFRWQNERDHLVEKKTEELGQQLQEARVGENVMRHDLAVLEEEERKFPPEARQEPDHFVGLLRATQQAANQQADALGDARRQLHHLHSLQEQRAQLDQACRQAERELKHAEILEELLSRKR